jgi:hypothetical protein
MASLQRLTKWQHRHKELLEEALINSDAYQELGYLRRDTSSPLKTAETQSSRDSRLKQFMQKYAIQPECFNVLQSYCINGGDFDYTLIPDRKLPRIKQQAKRDEEIYRLWVYQGIRPKEITDYMRAKGWDIDVQYVSKIIKRMYAADPNRSRNWRPPKQHKSSGH